MKTMVTNKNGTKIDWDVAVSLMDDELMSVLTLKNWFDTEQEYFTAYEKAHEEKYGEEWELSKANPTY